ncbi:ArpU family phage packaging/lysis transcriptional regulator [Parageobacillus thermantarcticus]|nr:ArpU family phage packaging/lysis transcriptional regulator [Parageobacillus thermantarcticus]
MGILDNIITGVVRLVKYKQLSFLRDVDGEKTKEAVEAALEKYRMYMLTVPDEFLPRVTQTYSLVPPSQTNAFHSSTEDAAIKKVDFERERDEYMRKIVRAVNRLTKLQRELIVKRYMTFEEPRDCDVYNDMCISESKYYREREKAFYKIAFALGIEVYKEEAPV